MTRTSYYGTNTGAFMGMPATGKWVPSTGIDITRLAHGKSVEQWGQLALLGLLQQLGVIRTAGPGGA